MLVIKDAMALIHLAKTSLLEDSCAYFGSVAIPSLVHKEVDKPEYVDALIIRKLIKEEKIKVKPISNRSLIRKAEQFGIYEGEAEAIALYWELEANMLATDDDNVRRKRDLLNINLIGTPVIILKLYKEKKIDKKKLKQVVEQMRKIGWFSSTIWDKIQMEAEHE